MAAVALRWVTLATVCKALVLLLMGVQGRRDLMEEEGQFTFIYHSRQELFLTVHQNASCYYSHVEDHVRMNDPLVRAYVKNKAKRGILNEDNNQTRETTLSAMRDRYEDRLADFRCLDKHIYTLQLQVPRFTCDEGSGRYADPVVCSRYYWCDGQQAVYFACSAGTVWDDVSKACVTGECGEK